MRAQRGLALVEVAAGEHDVGAPQRQHPRRLEADAGVGAGDDGGAAGLIGDVVEGPGFHGALLSACTDGANLTTLTYFVKCERRTGLKHLCGGRRNARLSPAPRSAYTSHVRTIVLAATLLFGTTAGAAITWPASQQFPSFAPVGPLDVIDAPGRPNDALTMLVTLQGVVNRTAPRIYVSDGGAGDRLWLAELAVPATHVSDPFALVAKYRDEVAGIVIYDDAQPDTLNLATTIAGQSSAIVASPALAATLTARALRPAGRSPICATNHFASKLEVYQYELDHYSARATHRLIIGLTPSIPEQPARLRRRHQRDDGVARPARRRREGAARPLPRAACRRTAPTSAGGPTSRPACRPPRPTACRSTPPTGRAT